MEKNLQNAPLSGAMIRAILVLVALAAFVLAAGAPICFMC